MRSMHVTPVFDVAVVEEAGFVCALEPGHAVHVHAEEVLQLVVLTWRHFGTAVLLKPPCHVRYDWWHHPCMHICELILIRSKGLFIRGVSCTEKRQHTVKVEHA